MEVVQDPYNFIEKLFAQQIRDDNDEINFNFDECCNHFDDLLVKYDFASKVPLFNKKLIGTFAPNSLVKYTGVVLDMFDPELYCCTHRNNDSGSLILSKYRDFHSHQVDLEDYADDVAFSERTAYICGTIGGESSWVKKYSGNDSTTVKSVNINQKCKRGRDSVQVQNNEVDDFESHKVRLSSNTTIPQGYNSRLVPTDYDACMVKVYDSHCVEDVISLLDMVEFVCIYTCDPVCDVDKNVTTATDSFAGSDTFVVYPPASLVPRLHCVTYRKLSSSFPLLQHIRLPSSSEISCVDNAFNSLHARFRRTAILSNGSYSSFGEMIVDDSLSSSSLQVYPSAHWTQHIDWMYCRQRALEMIAAALDGDVLTAEFVLLTVLSRVYARHYSHPLGIMPCQLRGLKSTCKSALLKTLSQFAPRCIQVDARSESLNAVCMRPVKDSVTGVMTCSPLQLAAGTILLIDEGAIESCDTALTPRGMRSIEAIRGVVATQQLAVDCGYSTVFIPTELPCILVSSDRAPSERFGDSSIVTHIQVNNCDVQLQSEIVGGCAITSTSVGELEQDDMMRLWWAAARQLEPSMDSDVMSLVENTFVQTRIVSESTSALVGTDDMHRWLTLARLMSISCGEEKITESHWHHILQLEVARNTRNRSY